MTHEVVAFDHIQLAMPPGAEAEAEAFFAGILGLVRVTKPEPFFSRGGCWFEAGPVQLHLGAEADFAPARKAHPALRVRGLDDLASRLVAGGYEPRWTDEHGDHRFHADDCFGNRLEFIDT